MLYHRSGFCRYHRRKLDELSRDPIREATVRVVCYTQPFGVLTLEPRIWNLVRRRFSLPEANDPYRGTYNVSAYGPACTQQNSTILPLPEELDPAASGYMNLFRVLPATPEAEDCGNHYSFSLPRLSVADPQSGLTLNVIKPTNVHPKAKLPVAVVSDARSGIVHA